MLQSSSQLRVGSAVACQFILEKKAAQAHY
jgi:hypothetical protein